MFLNKAIAQHPEVAPFWEAASEKKFVVPECEECGQAHWYPRGICPHCFSQKLNWKPSQGVGTIYSFTVARMSNPPYVVAYVALEEGPIMMANIVDDNPDSIRIGQRVEIVMNLADEGQRAMPHFVRR